MHYSEAPPSAALRPFVRCLWHLRSTARESAPERIVPDGCAELIVNRADVFRRLDGARGEHLQARVLLVGQLRAPIWIVPTGHIDLLGIRFRPGGLHALTGVPMHELTGEDFCVGQLDEELRADLARAAELPEESARTRAVEAVLAGAYSARRARPGLVAHAVADIERGVRTSESLSRALGIHRRALERSFREEIGLTPKQLIRIHRLQSVLAHLDACRRTPSWAALAAAHGYVDQSHLIREFKQLAGTTPARHLASRTDLASCFEGLSHSSNTGS